MSETAGGSDHLKKYADPKFGHEEIVPAGFETKRPGTARCAAMDGKSGRMFSKLVFAAAGLAFAVSTPVQANETATTTQITGAVGTHAATGDREFSELF